MHMLGWSAGATGAGVCVDYADDPRYRRGYARGAQARESEQDCYLEAPESVWPSRAVEALFGPESKSDSDTWSLHRKEHDEK